ncbi:MAG: hypothetical protein ACK2UC_14645 [Anaerolineae bacterium]
MGVWAELTALGPAVREEPVFQDTQAVAQEIMSRAKQNVAMLVERLAALEYRFVMPDRVWTRPNPGITTRLDAFEQRFGPIPVVVRTWYEVIGGVNLMGAHPRLSHHYGLNWGGSEELGCYSDPMVVYWFGRHTEALVSFYLNLADDWDEMERMEEEMPPPYGIDLGLSAINKANHSGAGSVQIIVPNPAFDTLLIDWDDYWMGTMFVPYLRTCFQWGGFPGLASLEEDEQPKEELSFLTEGLLAL